MSEIFRKKSIEKVNSPEDLNDYMRVTNPSIWFALVCVILILIGLIFWGTTAKLETKADAVAVNDANGVICYVNEDTVSDVRVGTIVRIDKTEYTVKAIGQKITLPGSNLSEYEMSLAGFKNGEAAYELKLEGEKLDTSSKADVILEQISPVSFLFGNVD